MNFAGLILLIAAHYLTGRGVLKLFRLQLERIPAVCLSMIVGVVVLSFVPCVIQLLHLPITTWPVGTGLTIATCLFSIPLLRDFKSFSLKRPALPRMYEWPFLLALLLLILPSIWRCYYFPPIPRDLITGPELLAEFAVREYTMISSVFSVDLHSTNNYFKSPFITSLQIIYKLFVSPFGQVWLSILFVSFTVLLYSILRRIVHPLLAGVLLLLFTAIPELYAYTFMVLYDYSNMILFFCGFYFLVRFAGNKQANELLFSAIMFGLATYVRTETLILVLALSPAVLLLFIRDRPVFKRRWLLFISYFLIPALFYFICINVFVRNFVPVPFELSKQLNPDLSNVSEFFGRLRDEQTELIFSSIGIQFFGYFVFLFYFVLLLDLIWIRRFSRARMLYLYGVFVVFVGLAAVGYLFPLADLFNTTKRGLFKALPLMLLYMANSEPAARLSNAIKKFELKQKRA